MFKELGVEMKEICRRELVAPRFSYNQALKAESYQEENAGNGTKSTQPLELEDGYGISAELIRG